MTLVIGRTEKQMDSWVRKNWISVAGFVAGIFFAALAWIALQLYDQKGVLGGLAEKTVKVEERVERIANALPDQVSLAAGEMFSKELPGAFIVSMPYQNAGKWSRTIAVFNSSDNTIIRYRLPVSDSSDTKEINAALGDMYIGNKTKSTFENAYDYMKRSNADFTIPTGLDLTRSVLLAGPPESIKSQMNGMPLQLLSTDKLARKVWNYEDLTEALKNQPADYFQ